MRRSIELLFGKEPAVVMVLGWKFLNSEPGIIEIPGLERGVERHGTGPVVKYRHHGTAYLHGQGTALPP